MGYPLNYYDNTKGYVDNLNDIILGSYIIRSGQISFTSSPQVTVIPTLLSAPTNGGGGYPLDTVTLNVPTTSVTGGTGLTVDIP